MGYDTVLIVDAYQRNQKAEQNNYQVDAAREAQGLSMLVRALGRHNRRVAIVPENDPETLAAYRGAGFSIRPMNGNRPTELVEFLNEESRDLRANPPDHLVVMTTDPAFELLCSSVVSNKTKVSVWAPDANVPPQLVHPDYDYRQLDELLPGTKIKVATVVVYLDYENLHIGLEHMGISPDPRAIVEAVRSEIADLGNIADIIAYADWSQLSEGSNRDIQRELVLLGVKTRYQIGVHGKNSSDMAMANDIRTRVDRHSDASDATDTVVLGTCDSDFSTIVETAKARGKKVVILALQEGLSRKLAQLAQVRYLDRRLSRQGQNHQANRATDEQFTLLMRIAMYLKQNNWRWAHMDKLAANVSSGSDGTAQLREAVKVGLLKPGRPGRSKTLTLDLNNPDAYAAWWIYNRIDYLFQNKRMPYVDTNYLAQGMSMDGKCQELGIGQTRLDAQRELERAVATGCIVKKSQKHPKNPVKIIDTWWPVSCCTNEQRASSSQRGADR